MTFRRIALTL